MQAITSALYYLLSNPEYVEPLRHEVETVVAEEGWTKAAMDKMHKIDSFVRETLRTRASGICPLIPLARLQLLILCFLFQWRTTVLHYVHSHFRMGLLS